MPREPKKSEVIEIRVSHETKEAFRAKAESEGKSVSALLRQLIDECLARQPEDTMLSKLKGSIMSFARILKKRPRFVAGALSGLFLGGAVMSLPASAEDISVAVRAEFTEETEGQISRRAHEADVLTDYDTEILLDLESPDGKAYRLVFMVVPQADETLRMEITVYDGTGEDAVVLARPVISMTPGADATVEMGKADETGEMVQGMKLQFNITETA